MPVEGEKEVTGRQHQIGLQNPDAEVRRRTVLEVAAIRAQRLKEQ